METFNFCGFNGTSVSVVSFVAINISSYCYINIDQFYLVCAKSVTICVYIMIERVRFYDFGSLEDFYSLSFMACNKFTYLSIWNVPP